MTTRLLDWDGCYGVRDLGGLPLTGGGTTNSGELVRSSAAFLLTEAGWAAARAYGIRTVIDLMNPDEYAADAHPRPADITTVRVPLDNVDDREFWDPLVANGHWGTAIYYRPFLARYPETVATVVRAIAAAGPGGVMFHCGRGQDRTGIISLILLALAGVEAGAIADDYEVSRSPAVIAAQGGRDDTAKVQEILDAAGTTNRAAIVETVTGLDAAAFLTDAGVSAAEIGTIRRRLRQ